MLRQVMQAGMDVARLNLSHEDHATHSENIRRIRATAAELDKPVAILADLQGPKLRVGRMADSGVRLEEGSEAVLTTGERIGHSPKALPVQYKGLPEVAQAGDRILIDDGLLELTVLSTTATEITCRVTVGGVLKSNKGMNLPRTPPSMPAITAKDRADLAFAVEQRVDWIALSFVRTADDVRELKRLIRDLSPQGDPIPVVAKIEKPQALENMDAIIAEADGIMVARGDLGVEIPPEEVPMAQKQLIQACNTAGLPVITATQMLDSMIRNPRPTRAEVSDVANAILDGTDAIMLSGETSIGAYPVAAVKTMDRIARRVEEKQPEFPDAVVALTQQQCELGIAGAVAHAVRQIAHSLNTSAIITPTTSGYTARLMSRDRPRSPIVATTSDPAVQRRLTLYWGVMPLLAPRAPNTDDMIDQAVQVAQQRGLVRDGDTVVITAGAAGSAPGTTNLIRILVVGQQDLETPSP
jgi:pyruvate kinase